MTTEPMTSTSTSTTTNEHEHLVSCLDAAEDLLQEIEQACGIETTMRASFDQVKAHAEALAARVERLEAERQVDRDMHREELDGMEHQIRYAIRYGELDTSMGQPQPHRQSIQERMDELEAKVNRYDIAMLAAASYIELLEQGKGPSDPAYLPLRDCYRNAVEDLADTPADPPTPSTPRGAQS